MPQNVVYRIEDRSDGRFDVVVSLESGKVFKRSGCVTRAEVDAWIDGLRILMAADEASRDARRFGSQTARDADQTTS
jgi:hypothetical protein